MKKIIGYVFAVLVMLGIAMPVVATQADAARIAVVPLIVNMESNELECKMLFNDAVVKIYKYPAHDLAETELVEEAVKAEKDVFSKEAMMNIAKSTQSDIVLAVSLDRFGYVEHQEYQEPTAELQQGGQYATYNRLTGEYKAKKWNNDDEYEIAFTVKNDLAHKEFARAMRRLVKSAVR